MDHSATLGPVYEVLNFMTNAFLIALFIAVGISGIACGVFAGQVAWSKNRSAFNWFVAGLFCNIIALIAIAGMPSLPARRRAILEPEQ
jgi:hypothetical protein